MCAGFGKLLYGVVVGHCFMFSLFILYGFFAFILTCAWSLYSLVSGKVVLVGCWRFCISFFLFGSVSILTEYLFVICFYSTGLNSFSLECFCVGVGYSCR